jgi:hypothetical protein
MRRVIFTAGAALLVAVPAAIGLVGNTSFAQSVPVRVPAQATLVDETSSEHPDATAATGDDKGGQRITRNTGTGDDKGGQRATSNTLPGNTSGSPSDSGPGTDKNGGHGRSSNRTSGGNDGSGHR